MKGTVFFKSNQQFVAETRLGDCSDKSGYWRYSCSLTVMCIAETREGKADDRHRIGPDGSSSSEYSSPAKTEIEQNEEEIELQPVEIKEGDASVSAAELDDDDTELWLISVPRHDSVRATLPGSKLRFPNLKLNKASSIANKRRVGVLRGSYVYREHELQQHGSMRPAFVVKDKTGRPYLKIAKPFSRSISVAFDTEMGGNDDPAPPKKYPEMPQDLALKYFPIGSKKRNLNS